MNLKDQGSMFFDNFELQKEYTFRRMKSSLDRIKELSDNEQTGKAPKIDDHRVYNRDTIDTIILINKSEVSVLIPLAQWFNNMVELKYWQSETLQEALKIIWKV